MLFNLTCVLISPLRKRVFEDVLKSKKSVFICFNDGSSKMKKNTFYFTLKALFVLKVFKFLSWLFGHVEKTALLEG